MKKPHKDKARSGKNGGFMGKSDLLLTGFKPQKRATATPAEVLLYEPLGASFTYSRLQRSSHKHDPSKLYESCQEEVEFEGYDPV